MSLDLVARVLKDDARRRELQRCQDDLYYLCSEVLEYKWNPSKQQGMTEAFHGPLCSRMDRLRDHPRILTLAPRKHLKTTVFTIGLAIQEILRDPNVTILIPHAVEEEAIKIVAEITDHFKANKRLRSLEPSIMPATNGKWWYGSGRMRLRTPKYSRQPTVMGVGAGSEIGGAHCDLIMCDDIIGRRTIENSEMPKIASWWQNTAVHVLNNAGRVRAVGTRWHPDDIWQDFIDSGLWDVCVRACLETDGKPDDKGTPVHYGTNEGDLEKAQKRLEVNRLESKGDFAAQMMNNPSPESEKPWDRQAEHVVDKAYVKTSAWTFWVIHDPAPAKVGSLDLTGAKSRADGTKDFWAIACIGTRRRGARMEIVLVELDQSREWTVDEGLRRGCQMQRRWGARRVAIEQVGQAGAMYTERMRIIAREEGCRYSPVALQSTMKGKNLRFGALCSRAKADEFLICTETIKPDMLEEFLRQAREWRPLESGRNALKYDDLADVVSYSTDMAIDVYEVDETVEAWSPFKQKEEESPMGGSRYVHW